MRSYLKLLRPHQWTKNGVVFAALIFSRSFTDVELCLRSLAGFIAFCLASSCVYIINDIADRDKDRAHPKKCSRPIASGAVKVPSAIGLIVVLFVAAFVAAFWLSLSFGLVLTAYFVMNLAYSFRLKQLPIFDIMCVALGFVFRAMSGSFLIDKEWSPWMLMCAFLLALFLGIEKRRAELTTKGADGRAVLEAYSADILREMSGAVNGTVIIAYSLWCVFGTTTVNMIVTVPFVVYGLFRYLFIAHKYEDLAESPDIALFKDKPLLVDIALWIVLCAAVLWFAGDKV